MAEAHMGAVAAAARTDSALRLNVHIHVLALDGVYLRAEVRGVNVYANQCVDGRDRRQLERLCKYVTRPPIAQDRLERRPDGKLELSFKSVWKDASRGVVLEPHDLIVRLIAAVPPPRWHTLRYFGLLSSHAAARSEVVPKPPPDATLRRADAMAGRRGHPRARRASLAKLGLAPQPPPATKSPPLGQRTFPFQ
jgi:hypothetical protein